MSTSGRSGQSASKRLLKELKSYDDEPNPALVHLGPVSDDELLHWTAVMKGVPGTAYEDGLWQLNISIPPNYPNAPPSIHFVTPICHPNIHIQTGEICLDLLKTSWSPAYTISTTLTSVHQLLTSAEPESPLNVDIAQMFRAGDLVGAESLIRLFTEMHRYEGS